MNQGRVELLDIKRLAAQLKALERRTRTGGKDQVDHGPGGQDDVANAAAGACVIAAQNKGMEEWGIRWIDMNTGAFSGGEDKTPPEYRPLNDEVFVIKYLAYIRRYEMIDAAAKKLGMDPALIKRWVQDNGRMLGSVMSYRADEIRAIYDSLA